MMALCLWSQLSPTGHHSPRRAVWDAGRAGFPVSGEPRADAQCHAPPASALLLGQAAALSDPDRRMKDLKAMP